MIPEDLRYTEEHEWVRLQGDVAEIGITHFAQDQLGDIVFVELPAVGFRLELVAKAGTVEQYTQFLWVTRVQNELRNI